MGDKIVITDRQAGFPVLTDRDIETIVNRVIHKLKEQMIHEDTKMAIQEAQCSSQKSTEGKGSID